MNYIVAVLVVISFSMIHMISYLLNSEDKMEGDKKSCEGCLIRGCINRFEEEEK